MSRSIGLLVLLLLVPTLARADGEILGRRESEWLRDLGGELAARRAAVFALGQLGIGAGPGVIPALTRRLADPDVVVRAGAARALGELFQADRTAPPLYWDATGPALLTLARDREARARRAALVALGSCGAKAAPAVETIRKALAAPEAEVRQNAAWALGAIGIADYEAVLDLCERLHDEDSLVRRDTVAALAELYRSESNRPKMKDAGPALVRLLASEITPEGKARDEVVLTLTLEKLLTFGEVKLDNLAATLTPLMRGEEEYLARLAAMTLASAGGKDATLALPVLVRTLKSGDVTAQEMAAASLAQLGDLAEPAITELADAIRANRGIKVRQNAAIALTRLRAKARPALNALKESVGLPASTPDEVTLRTYVVEAIARMGYPANTEALPEMAEVVAKEADWNVRLRAVWAFLGCENLPPEGRKALEAALDIPEGDDRTGVRMSAARVLAYALREKAPLKVVEVLHSGLVSTRTSLFDGTNARVNAGNEQSGGTTAAQVKTDPDARFLYAIGLRHVGKLVLQSPMADKIKTDLEAAQKEPNRPQLNTEATKALEAINR